MSRTRLLCLGLLTLAPLGCRLPPEREPLRPLDEEGAARPYVELIDRARVQFSDALDAFYLDSWKNLEELGKGLEQTARFLPKSAMPPAGLKADVILKSKEMRGEAVKLSEAARVKDASRASEALRNLNLLIRELRPMSITSDKGEK